MGWRSAEVASELSALEAEAEIPEEPKHAADSPNPGLGGLFPPASEGERFRAPAIHWLRWNSRSIQMFFPLALPWPAGSPEYRRTARSYLPPAGPGPDQPASILMVSLRRPAATAEVYPRRRRAKWRRRNAIGSTPRSPVTEFAVPVFVPLKQWQSLVAALPKKHRSRRLHIMPRAEGYRSAYPRTNQGLSSSRANASDLTKFLLSVARSYAHNETGTAARNHRARQNKSLRTRPASSRSLWTLP